MAETNANDNRGLVSKIVIPYYDPASTKITARGWIGFVELARDSAGTYKGKYEDGADIDIYNWSDKQTCTNAMLLLQGTANKWIEAILENKGEELSNWSKFKSSFKERFIRSLTLTEKMNLRDLKMTSTETCRDFYDRCNNNINLFFDDEWENLIKGERKPTTPWAEKDATVTDEHIRVSKVFLNKSKAIELKLAYVTGLKDSIKKQVLFQQAETVQDILTIAQRVESGLREIKKSDIAILNIGDSDDNEESADVGAVNFRKKKNFKAQGGAKASGQGGQFKCFYCLKSGHYKKNCITMRNDRQKGIFKTNINASPSTKSKARMNSVETGEDEDDDDVPNVNNCQTDLSHLLNFHSV
jgi:hypothetical protein